MSFLEMVFSLIPFLFLGVVGFASGDDPPADPPADPPVDLPKIDPEITAILDNKEALAEYITHQRQKKRDANEEAKGLRLKLEAFEKEKKDKEDADLLEQGKHKELLDAEKADNAANKKNFLTAIKLMGLKLEAINQGIIDTDVIDLIEKIVTIDVEMDDNYNVTNAEEIIKEFKEKKPGFFADNGDDDEENKIIKPVPDNQQANLKSKIKGNVKDVTPDERIRSGLDKKK